MSTATLDKSEALTEYAINAEPLKVDAEKGIIYGVKILGAQSKNGRTYTEAAMRQAVGLYEGAKANVNHPKGSPKAPRDVDDRLGSFRAVEHRAGDGLFGNLHYNPKHRLAESIAWAAEHSPSDLGFSHNVEARTSRQNGRVFVEAITQVTSVDLVADPATTNGFYESIQEPDAMSLTEVTLEQIKSARPDLVSTILTEAQSGESAKAQAKRLAELETENKALKEEKAVASHKASVDAKLTEAKLELTDAVRNAAYALTEAELPGFIEGLQGLVKTAKPAGQRPKSTEQTACGGAVTESFDHVNDAKSFLAALCE